jgi:hypothetical protein
MLNLSIDFTLYSEQMKNIIEHQVSFFSILLERYKTEVKPLCYWAYAIFAPTEGIYSTVVAKTQQLFS